MEMSALSFQRDALHAAYRAGLSPQAVITEALRRLEAANDPGIFLDVTPLEHLRAEIAGLSRPLGAAVMRLILVELPPGAP